MFGYLKGGFKSKYRIKKIDDSPIDENAKYFVLRYDVDPHARKAMETYANSIQFENNKFACDILKQLDKTREIFQENQRKLNFKRGFTI